MHNVATTAPGETEFKQNVINMELLQLDNFRRRPTNPTFKQARHASTHCERGAGSIGPGMQHLIIE